MKLQETEYQQDRKWADSFLPQIEKAVKHIAGKIIDINISSDKEDCEEATDYVITVATGKIACRIRRPTCSFRDITIRAYRVSGAKTELEKLKEGAGAKWYFYAWTYQNILSRYVVIDIEKMRKKGFLHSSRSIQLNKDGRTGFISFTIDELTKTGCVIFDSKNPRW